MEWYSTNHLYTDYPKNERREEIERLNYEELTEDFYDSCNQLNLEINQEDAQLLIDAFNDEYECKDIENIKHLLKDITIANYENIEEKHLYLFNYFRKLGLNDFGEYKYLQNLEEIITWMMYESYMYQVCLDKETYEEDFYDFECLLNKSIKEITKRIEANYYVSAKLILLNQLIEIISHFFENNELYDNCSRILKKTEYDFEMQLY